MKKILFYFLLSTSTLSAYCQTLLEGNKFFDNWSVGLKGGTVTPLTHSAFFKNMRPAVGVDLTKQLTPAFGLGVEGMGYINTSNSRTAFDASNISLLGKFNLMNLLGGYHGVPRTFEMETVLGAGWLHYYENGKGDINSWSTKIGLNFNFNLGSEKKWTLALQPALVYDMEGDFNEHRSRFNANNAAVEITAGIVYHFKNSNGKHYFTMTKPYDQAEIDGLNRSINELRMEVDSKKQDLNSANQKLAQLSQMQEECQKREPQVQTVVETAKTLESVVTFRQGKSSIDASQLPNVERIATYLNKHSNAKVVVKGYASPEGSIEVNERIAQARANAVMNLLVKKYRISADRITAKGQGIGNMFSEADWNRVSICTIEEGK